MANRIVGNVYIVDSQQIHLPLPFGSSSGTLACTTANVGKMNVTAVIFMATNTAARAVVALMSTANVILDYTVITAGTGTHEWQRTQVDHFGYGVPMTGIMIPVLTASTIGLVLE